MAKNAPKINSSASLFANQGAKAAPKPALTPLRGLS
jgi:hypothetical protein